MIQNNILTFNFFEWFFFQPIDPQSQEIYVEETLLKKTLHILEYSASGCASGHIEQVIVKKQCLNYDNITWSWWFPRKLLNDDLKSIWNSKYMKKKSSSK